MNRTKSTCSRLTPRPYGSAVKAGAWTTSAKGSCSARPASTVSSPVMASTAPFWNSTRQPVCVSAPTACTFVKVRSLVMLVDGSGAQTFLPARSWMPPIGPPLWIASPLRTSTF